MYVAGLKSVTLRSGEILTIVTDSKLQSNMKCWVVKGHWTLQQCHQGLAALESVCGSLNSAATWVPRWLRRRTGRLWRSCWRWAVNSYWSRSSWRLGGYCVWSCSLWICVSCFGMETGCIFKENLQIVILSLCVYCSNASSCAGGTNKLDACGEASENNTVVMSFWMYRPCCDFGFTCDFCHACHL